MQSNGGRGAQPMLLSVFAPREGDLAVGAIAVNGDTGSHNFQIYVTDPDPQAHDSKDRRRGYRIQTESPTAGKCLKA